MAVDRGTRSGLYQIVARIGAGGMGEVYRARDLKPANIKVSADGVVKILDFGLAKAFALTEADSGRAQTAIAETTQGVVLGTVGYMSPEQSRGQRVDKRTDIWAFGCVLPEMLTGAPVFMRASGSDTIAAIINAEPEWNRLPDETPEAVRRLLARCLQKDAKRRLHDIADARIELEDAAPPPPPSPVPARRSPNLLPWASAVAASGSLVVAWLAFGGSGTSTPTGTTADRLVRLTDMAGLEEAPAISPDGRSVAFTAAVGGKRQLFVQLIAGGAPLSITRADIDHSRAGLPTRARSSIFLRRRPERRKATFGKCLRSAARPAALPTASAAATSTGRMAGSRGSGSPRTASSS